MLTPTAKRASRRATPEERRNRSIIIEHIGHELRKHYQACKAEKLPPRLLALVKKFDEEIPEN
jgi:hypothetical protein